MNTAALLGVQIRARRGDILLAEALGAALGPEAFHRDIAAALKTAWISARTAEEKIHRAIVVLEHRPRVLPFRRRTS